MKILSGRKTLLLLTILAVLAMSLGGVLSMGMAMQDGKMQNCPFMGVTAFCNMSPLEHVATWQNMFSATVQLLTMFALLLLISLFLFARFLDDFLKHKRPLASPVFYRWRETEIFDPLRSALARGRIHPKTF